MTQSYLVPFYGDKLNLIDKDGVPVVAVRPIADRLGLNWPTQYRKLMSEISRWGVVMMTTPSAGGMQESICIPVQKIFSWLGSISPSKVADKVRPVLERYQAECDQVLFDFWTNKLSDAARAWREVAVAARGLELMKPIYRRVGPPARAGLSFKEVAAIGRPTYSEVRVGRALHMLLACDDLAALPDGTPDMSALATKEAKDQAQSQRQKDKRLALANQGNLFGGAA
jgi:hypothetical protein